MAANILVPQSVRTMESPVTPEEWMDDGACLNKDPDQWFPDTREEIAEAKEFCKTHCKVRFKCLAFAMLKEKPYISESGKQVSALRFGVFGGLDSKERKALQEEIDKKAEAEKEMTA
jgi:hypothetical protein